MANVHAVEAPSAEEVRSMRGPVVLEFGTSWCGWCRGAQPLIAQAFATRNDVRHIRVEDGPGRPLGRAYRVKLWPTLVFLKDGEEIARVTRPAGVGELTEALARIA